MAQEDILSKLNLLFSQKQDQDNTDDNTVLYKMIAPIDAMAARDSVLPTKTNSLAEVWGGTGSNTSWYWGFGQWR